MAIKLEKTAAVKDRLSVRRARQTQGRACRQLQWPVVAGRFDGKVREIMILCEFKAVGQDMVGVWGMRTLWWRLAKVTSLEFWPPNLPPIKSQIIITSKMIP